MGQEMGWKSPVILASFLVFLAFTVAFLVQEKRCRDPVVDLTLLKKRDFTLAQGASFLQMLILAGAISFSLLPGAAEAYSGRQGRIHIDCTIHCHGNLWSYCRDAV